LKIEGNVRIKIQSNINRFKIESDIRFGIDKLFQENGITIAFPQRDVHLDAKRSIEVKLVRDDGR